MLSRREVMRAGAAALAAGGVLKSIQTVQAADDAGAAAATQPSAAPRIAVPPDPAGGDYTPVVTPNGVAAPWKLVDGVKVFHLTAHEFKHEIAPGLTITAWGYNGRTPGPTIEAVEGDRVRLFVTNHLPEPTSVHWHGILLPNGMDGVAGLTQKPIPPGATFKYEFTLRQHGTHMYHPHFDEMTQMAMGMMGLFIIHPRRREENPPDRDFAIMLSTWKVAPGTSRPNPMEMTDFNLFTMNSKAYPGTEPLVVKKNQRVRIRLVNLSAMDHHPIHLHGHTFDLSGTDGGRLPVAQRTPAVTVLVPVGSTRDIDFIADNEGDWPLHCHMTHHVMNQMGHNVPNMIGVDAARLDQKMQKLLPDYMTMGQTGMGDMMTMPTPPNSLAMKTATGPFGAIDMGGMFTIVKIRDGIKSYDDPGWYKHPPGTVAEPATAEEISSLRDLSG